jgi:pimeloyl-ACP methyl ester carboxylesterase
MHQGPVRVAVRATSRSERSVRPVLLPAFERIGRRALRRRGVESRWTQTPQGRIHAYDARGSGKLPTIVLLHGISSGATPFGPVIVRLLRHVTRIVAPDYPGHGFSEQEGRLTPEALFESIRTVLDTLKVGPAIFVGNSLGGAVALRCAIDEPHRVRGLVLASPAGAHASEEEWGLLRAAFHVKSRADGRTFLNRLSYRSPWLFHLIAHEMPASLARRAVRELFESASNDNMPRPEELERLAMPILLLWGQHERILPDGNLAFFTRHLPRHTVIERPSTYAHCPQLDDPADLARRIVAFAETVQG